MNKLQARGAKLRPSSRVKLKLPEKVVEGFYASTQWRDFMAALIVARFGTRENARCEDPGCRSPLRRGIRIFGDHIVERRDGGADLNPANVLCRCGSCHTRKTADERRRRYHGGRGG